MFDQMPYQNVEAVEAVKPVTWSKSVVSFDSSLFHYIVLTGITVYVCPLVLHLIPYLILHFPAYDWHQTNEPVALRSGSLPLLKHGILLSF